MADIDSALRQWSSTASSNKPAGGTSIGSGLDDNLRQIQATVRQYLGSIGSTIASAATVDLSTADGRTIPISGTSTVTGLGTEVAGLEYILTATGTQVWKNSSALSLPGAADTTVVSGDYFLAQSKGSGNWAVPWLTRMSQYNVTGSAQGQIPFPATQNASTDANTLDDYEEGSWTPAIAFGGASVGITYSVQTAEYTKIGNFVFCRYNIALSNKGSSNGAAAISGIPFTAGGVATAIYVSPVVFLNMTTSFVNLNSRLVSGGVTAGIVGNTAAATSNATSISDTDFSNTTQIYGMLVFRV